MKRFNPLRHALSQLRTRFERPSLVTWDPLEEITVWVGGDGRYHVQWHGNYSNREQVLRVAQHLFAAAQFIAAQAGAVMVTEQSKP